MNIFDFFKRKVQHTDPHSLFSGGSGESFETAVVVNAQDELSGLAAEMLLVFASFFAAIF